MPANNPRPTTCTCELTRFNRHILLEVSNTLDEYGQFQVQLIVDGIKTFNVHLTDKTGEGSNE